MLFPNMFRLDQIVLTLCEVAAARSRISLSRTIPINITTTLTVFFINCKFISCCIFVKGLALIMLVDCMVVVKVFASSGTLSERRCIGCFTLIAEPFFYILH